MFDWSSLTTVTFDVTRHQKTFFLVQIFSVRFSHTTQAPNELLDTFPLLVAAASVPAPAPPSPETWIIKTIHYQSLFELDFWDFFQYFFRPIMIFFGPFMVLFGSFVVFFRPFMVFFGPFVVFFGLTCCGSCSSSSPCLSSLPSSPSPAHPSNENDIDHV